MLDATIALACALVVGVTTGCRETPTTPMLRWYVNPDNGGQAALAERCTDAADGRYRITTSLLPNDATAQREQLVRRLAARDESIDLMSLDPPFVPELAAAGFLLPFDAQEADALTSGVFRAPVESATWNGKLVAAPFWANTQLLWFRKSVAARAGLDPARDPVTWDEIIDAAVATGTTVEVPAGRYEGYMVWINALIASAGGAILRDPEAGREAKPAIDSEAGHRAAAVIAELAHSRAADPGLSTSTEEPARAAFQRDQGGFMVNWAYVHGAALAAADDGALARSVVDDIGWARYPETIAGKPSHPPLGGIHLAVGAFSKHPDFARDAVRCLTSEKSQRQYMLSARNPAARAAVYDDPVVRAAFPMADLLRESIEAAAPRPRSPYYPDVSAAVVRAFHPPSSVSPERTPAEAARLIEDVLQDRVLL